VRQERNRLLAARMTVEFYARALVPLRERIVALSQQQYNAMLLGVYQLLQAKQNEINAYREYIEAVRDYWVARADLERAVGTRLAAAGKGEGR
jgi:cobalt-zinc-cadmium efflux system outer membrane protein